MIFSLILFVSALSAIVAEDAVTPPPPNHGDFGGTKKDRADDAQKLLDAATDEQKAIFRSTNPLLIEPIKAFNVTFSVQSQAYSVLKSSFVSNKPQCDSQANKQADDIIEKARDDTIACLAASHDKILVEGKGFTEIRDLPEDTLRGLVFPLDDCFQDLKVKTVEAFGYVMLDHSICTKKSN